MQTTPNMAPSPSNDLLIAGADLSDLAVGEPSLESPKRAIAFHLIGRDDMQASSYWLGLFKSGSLKPQELLNLETFDTVFELAAEKGLAERNPIMLTDTSKGQPRFIYLLPTPGDSLPERAAWIHNLTSTLKAWSPERVGIYLAPELLELSQSHELLMQIMRELVVGSPTTDYFFLSGAHGTNAILNTALMIKGELDQDNILVYVFH